MPTPDDSIPPSLAPCDADAPWPPAVQRSAVIDTAARVQNGLFVYPLLWLAVTRVGGFAARHPSLVWGHAAGLAVILVGRWWMHRMLPQMLERDLVAARALFRLTSLAQNLYWGALVARLVAAPDAGPLRWIAFVVTVAIAAGGTSVVAIDRALAPSIPAVLFGPIVVAFLREGGDEGGTMALLCAMSLVYSVATSRVMRRDYWATQRAHLMLEQRAKALEALSRTDALTQIPNRLRFEEHLHQCWRDARRRREPLAVAVVDLDHFKRVNDTHGHPFGDLCLQAAAQALAAAVHRPGDLVARYGGEEFAVLMPATDLEGARVVARRLLARVAAVAVTQGARRVVLSCSVGVAAQVPDANSEMEQLVQRADLALYRAKQEGRARVVSLSDSGVTARGA